MSRRGRRRRRRDRREDGRAQELRAPAASASPDAPPPRPWLVDAAFWAAVAALLGTYAVVHADSPAFVLRWAVKLARAVALGEAPPLP